MSAEPSSRPRQWATRVTVYAQLFGQASFVKLNDVQTTTNGVWGPDRVAAAGAHAI